MSTKFDYFVILAGMRTGSNLLEDRLATLDAITAHGELFNPAFVGQADQPELFGMTPAMIAADPQAMLDAIRTQSPGLPGFRLFRDHSEMALNLCLDDPRCAKIVLRRNPVESYVSLQIARQTQQWRLGDMKDAKHASVAFEAQGFAQYLADTRGFYATIRERLLATGQAALQITYHDLTTSDVLPGLAAFLGVPVQTGRKMALPKKQNPRTLPEKVKNFDQMVDQIGAMDPLELYSEEVFEPSRKANTPSYWLHRKLPVMFMPVKCGPDEAVREWMAHLGGAHSDSLQHGLSQKEIRQWKRRNRDHQSFTVVRHPVHRAFAAFSRHIIGTGPDTFDQLRDTLVSNYQLRLPRPDSSGQIDDTSLRLGFLDFLTFIEGNLAGQTSLRVDGAWASQTAIVGALCDFSPPGHIFREQGLADDLAYLAAKAGVPAPDWSGEPAPPELLRIYDDEIERKARAAYQRDYMTFGFGRWR